MFNKRNYKKIFFSLFLLYLIFLVSVNLAYAGIGEWDEKLDVGAGETEFYETYKEGEGDVASQRIVKYIGGILAFAPFLGVHFIIRIVIAGYEWMTAGGNSEKIEIAKKRIKNAIIGVLIFAILYLIAFFFITNFARIVGYEIYE